MLVYFANLAPMHHAFTINFHLWTNWYCVTSAFHYTTSTEIGYRRECDVETILSCIFLWQAKQVPKIFQIPKCVNHSLQSEFKSVRPIFKTCWNKKEFLQFVHRGLQVSTFSDESRKSSIAHGFPSFRSLSIVKYPAKYLACNLCIIPSPFLKWREKYEIRLGNSTFWVQ